MLGVSGQALPLTGGSVSLISLWFATAGCGVSFEDHRQAKDPFLASVYWFHVYYTTRRILEELHITVPGDKSHSWYQNDYDARAYKRLCSEFGLSLDTDWRQKLDHGCQGLGSWSIYMTPSHEYRHAHQAQGIFVHTMDAIRHNDSIRTYVWATWDRKLRHVQISLALERDLTPKNNSWRMLMTRFLARRHVKQHRSL